MLVTFTEKSLYGNFIFCAVYLISCLEDDPHSRPQKDNKNDPLSQFFNDLGSYGRIKPASDKAEDEKVERQRMKDTTLHRYR